MLDEDPESLLADLATRGAIDGLSLAVATTDTPEKFETLDVLDLEGRFKSSRRNNVTKSIDRRLLNDDFVSI